MAIKKSEIKIISVHSHKGGVGKSTFMQFFAKYLAQVKKEKTCLIDLDFQAQGLRSIYLPKALKYDFSDLLLARESEKSKMVDDMPVKHEEIENLYFISNYFKPNLDIKKESDIKRKMYIKLANEIYTDEITDNLSALIKRLEKGGFKNCLIDCHPGLVLLSDEVIQKLQTRPIFITTANMISFIGLFQNLLPRINTTRLKSMGIDIIINRVPPVEGNFSLEKTLPGLISSGRLADDEKATCTKIMKDFVQKENYRIRYINENEQIRNMDTLINPDTLLSMDLPGDIKEIIESLHGE